MADDCNVISRRPPQDTTIAHLLLHVCYHCTFRYGPQGQDVSNGEGSFLASIDELPGVHALVGDEGFCMKFEAIGIAELHFGQWCASARIVNDIFDNTSDVTVLFCEVKGSELRRSLVQASMGRWSYMLGATPFCGLS